MVMVWQAKQSRPNQHMFYAKAFKHRNFAEMQNFRLLRTQSIINSRLVKFYSFTSCYRFHRDYASWWMFLPVGCSGCWVVTSCFPFLWEKVEISLLSTLGQRTFLKTSMSTTVCNSIEFTSLVPTSKDISHRARSESFDVWRGTTPLNHIFLATAGLGKDFSIMSFFGLEL